jgi:hypothetical protein
MWDSRSTNSLPNEAAEAVFASAMTAPSAINESLSLSLEEA